MFEQSAPKDWSRAFPPAEDESPSDSAEPAAGPAKSPLPPMPIGGPAPIPPEPPPPPPPRSYHRHPRDRHRLVRRHLRNRRQPRLNLRTRQCPLAGPRLAASRRCLRCLSVGRHRHLRSHPRLHRNRRRQQSHRSRRRLPHNRRRPSRNSPTQPPNPPRHQNRRVPPCPSAGPHPHGNHNRARRTRTRT